MGIRGPKSKFTDIACPNVSCPDYGITDMGNIAGNGTYKIRNEKVRKFICRTCGKSFNSRSGTVFYDLRTNKETFILALKMVLSDIPLRKISQMLDIKLDTIRDWLLRAANHSEKVNEIFLKDLQISKVELDELWTFVKKTNSRSGRPCEITMDRLVFCKRVKIAYLCSSWPRDSMVNR